MDTQFITGYYWLNVPDMLNMLHEAETSAKWKEIQFSE